MSDDPEYISLEGYERIPEDEMLRRAEDVRSVLSTRRTIRDFAPDPVPRALIESCIRTAGTAPSGANHQPWHFAVVSSPDKKKAIREAAEEEERMGTSFIAAGP